MKHRIDIIAHKWLKLITIMLKEIMIASPEVNIYCFSMLRA